MKRSNYLKNIWQPYPAIPSDSVLMGRIHSLSIQQTPVTMELLRDNQIHKVVLDASLAILKILAVGDLISVNSKNEVILLAPALTEGPGSPLNLDILKKWNIFERQLLSFFWDRDFLQLHTPSLVECPGTEPSLDVFSTLLQIGSLRKKLFLPTSPELHLKKALSLGADKLFEIARVYRNGEVSERHQPEFLMLEWYRAFSDLKSIQQDVVELVAFMAKSLDVVPPKKVESWSVAELFKHHCDFDFLPTTGVEELRQLADALGVDVRSAESIDDFFFLIFMEKIETQLDPENLIFVKDYPPYQAALARLTDEGWGDRFEVYWKGLELGNAFNELNDPSIQRLRSQEDLDKKDQMNKEKISLDEDFFRCLEAGMPPSGGIAMGVERLFMSLMDIDKIQEVQVFPHSRY